jgi:hypothetical protein
MNQDEFNFNAPPKRDASEVSGSLLEKIKKLLRLSSSANPHEAALAMSRAMALADQANLDLSSLCEDDDVGEIVQRWIPVGSRLARERQLALGIVQRYFNVKPIVNRASGAVMFIGTESDIAIAEYVFSFLTTTSRNCLKVYELAEKAARRRPTPTKRAQFLAGFFYGVANKLSGQRESTILEDSKFAIVLSNQETAREKYARENAGPTHAISLREPGRRNWSALESGFIEGRRTSINPGLSGKPQPLALE